MKVADHRSEGGEIACRRAVSHSGAHSETREESLAVEEPLEIRVNGRSLTVVMRTPGRDEELAAGLLFGEGIIRSGADIGTLSHCRNPEDPRLKNILSARLSAGIEPDWERLRRSFFSNTSCGLCGKTTIESVKAEAPPLDDEGLRLPPETLYGLPGALRAAQEIFCRTGGLHGCGEFDASGRLLAAREDVGRHNAVDKIVGAALLEGRLPLSRSLLLVSGRASFEIVQKALVARVPVVCAVSAPSSLAVDLAREAGMTLVGFLRERTFNVYAGAHRLTGLPLTGTPEETACRRA